jgi:hypothetical protein
LVVGGGNSTDSSTGTITITNENGEIELPGTIARYLNNTINMVVSSAIQKVNEDNRQQNIKIMEKVDKYDNKLKQTTEQMKKIKIAQEITNNSVMANEETLKETKQSIEKMEEAVQVIQENNNTANIAEIQNQVREESEATRNMLKEMMRMMNMSSGQTTNYQQLNSHQQSPSGRKLTENHQENEDQEKFQTQNHHENTAYNRTEPSTVTTTQETVSTLTKQGEDEDEGSYDEYNMKDIDQEKLVESLENTPVRNLINATITTPVNSQQHYKKITPSKRTQQERSSDEESETDSAITPKIQRIRGPIEHDEKVEINNKINITHIIKSKDNKGKITNTNITNNNNSNQPGQREKKDNKVKTMASPYNTRSQKPTRAGKPKVGSIPSQEPRYTPRKSKGGSRWGGNP